MRITAGTYRGRVLHVPEIRGLRPTPSRVREALFNILGDINGWNILDLFSGTGVIAIEALSRGAASGTSIEQHQKAIQFMQTSRKQWQLEHWNIMKGTLPAMLNKIENSIFDLVFADSPYAQGISDKIPSWLDKNAVSCRLLVIEESFRVNPVWPENWTLTRSRRYGDTCLYFLEKEST